MANDQKLSIGFLGVGGKLFIKDGFLNFSHPYGKTFKICIVDIDTVTIDTVGLGKGKLKIIGKGVELAKVEMSIIWANKCQKWILSKIR
ncbi:MAG: hypothetical protein PHW72_00280 [Candidatus Pacebacteria bacterium]|nr:hypothetical protein [Candidatus Paceibacterota bacterium]